MKYETSWCVGRKCLSLDEIIIPGNNIKISLFGSELISENGSVRNLWKICEKLYQIRNAYFKSEFDYSSLNEANEDEEEIEVSYPYYFIERFDKEKDGTYSVFMGS